MDAGREGAAPDEKTRAQAFDPSTWEKGWQISGFVGSPVYTEFLAIWGYIVRPCL